MGVDRYVTLGRITHEESENKSKKVDLVLFKEQVRYCDIVLQKCSDQEQPHRNYHINSFLGDHYYGCYIQSMVDPKKLSEQTEGLLNWMISEAIKDAREKGVIPKRQPWHKRPLVYDEKDFLDQYGLASPRGRRFFYPVSVLLTFDYNQIAMVGDEETEDSETVPDPKGETYLQKFERSSWRDKCGWEKFLNKLQSEQWDFVIFSFDN
jgi:hypothetical protein